MILINNIITENTDNECNITNNHTPLAIVMTTSIPLRYIKRFTPPTTHSKIPITINDHYSKLQEFKKKQNSIYKKLSPIHNYGFSGGSGNTGGVGTSSHYT